MRKAESSDLVQLLREIEEKSLQHGFSLPEEEDIGGQWEGVWFSIAGEHVVSPLSEVREIINYPRVLTRVPGTLPWVRGVANVRGNLLPIIDLQVFVGGDKIAVSRRSRILVIDHKGLFAGLLVEDVIGMKHFRDEQYTDGSGRDGAVAGFTQGAFSGEGKTWPIFSLRALVNNPTFQVAAA